MAWTAPSRQSTGTLISAAAWNLQVTDNMTFAGSTHNHSGDAGDGAAFVVVPVGMIAIFDAACPSGWTRVSGFDAKMLRGAATYGGTGGADTHTHPIAEHYGHTSDHLHALPVAGLTTLTGAASAKDTYAFTTTDTAYVGTSGALTSDAGSTLPAYISVVFCKKD